MTSPAENRLMAAFAADLLGIGRALDAVSRLATLAGAVGAPIALAGPVRPALAAAAAAAVGLGILQSVYAARVALDAALFRRLAGDGPGETPDLRAFDAAMVRLKLLPHAKSGRPMEERVAGARALLVRQAGALVAQLVTPLLIAVIGVFA
jgi:hypothetical protein